ncbi:MAG TPA: hypothetical protein VE984_07890 [Gaiellaceae bacterium]|nr:hypothetical protein [Gaiellaceae bacterium]
MDPLVDEPAISLFVRQHDEPGIEVRVNFGVFAGRHATPAEIDELAAALRDFLPSFAIVSEERHEFGGAVEASVHQVVVEVPQEQVAGGADVLAQQIVLAANGWALECIASRQGAGDL